MSWRGASGAPLAAAPAGHRPLLANLMWAAKEATAKLWRAGLRLDVRHAVVTLGDADRDPGGWRALRVDSADGARPATFGGWRTEPGWVMAIAGRPVPAAPRRLSGLGASADQPADELEIAPEVMRSQEVVLDAVAGGEADP